MPIELHPVSAAYRECRRAGALDLPARRAAVAAWMRAHPQADPATAAGEVSRIIAEAARDTPEILWRGVGGHPVDRTART